MRTPVAVAALVLLGAACVAQGCTPEGPWEDPETGLTWQRSPPRGRIGSYPEARGYCEALELWGHDDWRLPGLEELRTLVAGCDATAPGGGCPVGLTCGAMDCWTPPCDGCGEMDGPGELGCFWRAALRGPCMAYWSSTPLEDAEDRAWGVDFSAAFVGHFSELHHALNVRCVRGAGDGTGTWMDPATGLEWERRTDDEDTDLQAAQERCEDLEITGDADWRLPTLDELRTVIVGCDATAPGGACGATGDCLDEACWIVACNGCEDLEGPAFGGCYRPAAFEGVCTGLWSTSPCGEDGVRAWGVGLYAGFVGCYSALHDGLHVRCVRGP